MSVAFYAPHIAPLLMNPANFGLCATEMEGVVDSLKDQFAATTPGSREARNLLAVIDEHLAVLGAFRVLAQNLR